MFCYLVFFVHMLFFFFFCFFFFFFNDTATTEIYTLSLHDALPICACAGGTDRRRSVEPDRAAGRPRGADRKSTRLNSSHMSISYAVFCLKKKKKKKKKTYYNKNKNESKKKRIEKRKINKVDDNIKQ